MAIDGRLAAQLRLRARIVEASKARRSRRRAPRAQPPTALAREYQRALAALIDPLDDIAMRAIEAILPQLVQDAPLPRSDSRFDADASGLIERTMAGIRVQFAQRAGPREIEGIARRIGVDTSRFNRDQINRQFRSVLGVDLPGQDPFLAQQLDLFRASNVSLVTRMTDEQLALLEQTLQQAARSGMRVEEIRRLVQSRFGVTQSRANLIARDQVLKLNSELTQMRQREAGIEEYEWISSAHGQSIEAQEAQRVRHSHAVLDGTIQRWDKPPIVDPKAGRRAHPGEDFQCRCTANPIIRLGDQVFR